MSVDAHLARAVAACRVVAYEPGVVVCGCGLADGVLELGDKGDGGEGAVAGVGRAEDAFWGDATEGGGQAVELKGVFAEAAAEGETLGVLEADRVRDLAFQGVDFEGLRGRRCGWVDGVFACVETETFGEADGVGAGDGGTEALDWGEDLLVEIPVDVGLEGRRGGNHVARGIRSFGGGFRGRGVAGGGGGHDVRDHVVDADRFALGKGAECHLDLRHTVRVWIILGVLAEFLWEV